MVSSVRVASCMPPPGRWTTWRPACATNLPRWGRARAMSGHSDPTGDDRVAGRTGRREQNKAENRAALLKAARAVFAERGYGATGVRDIVRHTDLASGTFYNYFTDKDEIFEAVVGELTGELLKRHPEGPAQARTTEEFVRAHYAAYFNFIADDPELLALA